MKQLIFTLCFVGALTQLVQGKEERIKYHLKFGFLKGGEAEFTIKDSVINGKAVIIYHLEGNTVGLVDKFVNIHDIYETIVDAESHLPIKIMRNIKEGNYRRFNETMVYHDKDTIHSRRSGWRQIPDNMVDMISIFFYFVHKNPFENLQPGDAVTYPTYFADKISDMTIKYLREENIKTEIGKINCYVLKPYVDKGKVLKTDDAVDFYITKEQKLPVFVEFELLVGSLKAVAASYKINGVEQLAK